MPRASQSFLGKFFGKLQVVERSTYHGNIGWRCRCECGNEITVPVSSLTSGSTKSCGCLRAEVLRKRLTTHSMARTPTYRVFLGMHARCKVTTHRQFEEYGGRGIKVCDRWSDFTNFFEDMGVCPRGMSIERKDNNGSYEPGNCVWDNARAQALNRRTTTWETIYGERLCVTDWARRIGISQSYAQRLYVRGRLLTVIDQWLFQNP
jgi:hypothetical protein